MGRRQSEPSHRPPELGDLQLAVLGALWRRGRATVTEIHADLAPSRGLAPTTVATVLTRLEKRGVVAHEKEGRVFVYRARYAEREVKRSMVAALTERLFRGDPLALVRHLLAEREIDPEELDDLKRQIEAQARRAAGEER